MGKFTEQNLKLKYGERLLFGNVEDTGDAYIQSNNSGLATNVLVTTDADYDQIVNNGHLITKQYYDVKTATISGDIIAQIPTGYISDEEMTVISGDIIAQIPTDYISDSEMTTISGDIIDQIPTDYISDAEMTVISGDIIAQIPTDYISDAEMTVISGDILALPKIGTPTYTTSKDWFKLSQSPGRITGGEITLVSGTTIAVAAGTGWIRATDSDVGELYMFDWAANNSIVIPDSSIRYIGVEYNSGSPQVVSRTSYNWNFDSEFPLGSAITESINGVQSLHVISNPWWTGDAITNVTERMNAISGRVMRDESVGGLILSVPGTRNIAVSAGTLWSNLNEFPVAAIDTSVTGTIEGYWYKAGEGWQDADLTQYSVTQWNDVTQTTLQTIDNNKFCNVWIYAEADDEEIALIYPQAQYLTAAGAEAVGAPTSLPSHITNNGILIGRVIIKQGVDAPVSVQSAFGTSFTASVVTDHGNLSGLSDDDHAQYHNDTRGDARYYTETEVDVISGALNAKIPAAGLTMVSGSYTGDGSTSKAITGLGGQPKRLEIYCGSDATFESSAYVYIYLWTYGLSTNKMIRLSDDAYVTNRLVSINSGGFTVTDGGGDNDPNANGYTYKYVVWY